MNHNQIPCVACIGGFLKESVTYSSNIEVPLLVCDFCSFQCNADDFDPNEEYCHSCAEKGDLSLKRTERREDHNERATYIGICTECGEEEEQEYYSADL